MNLEQEQAYYYPNNMGRIIFLAMEDVLGRSGLNTVLNHIGLAGMIENIPPNNFDRQFRFEVLGNTMEGMERYFGPRAGRGLALRSGRACFMYGLREFGPLFGIQDMAFRLLPLSTKLEKGAQLFAQVFNRFSDQQVRLEETGDKLLWHIDRCPVCWQRETDDPCCHLAVGILQEALYWIGGGKYFCVEETRCIAQGASACTVEIDKQPLTH